MYFYQNQKWMYRNQQRNEQSYSIIGVTCRFLFLPFCDSFDTATHQALLRTFFPQKAVESWASNQSQWFVNDISQKKNIKCVRVCDWPITWWWWGMKKDCTFQCLFPTTVSWFICKLKNFWLLRYYVKLILANLESWKLSVCQVWCRFAKINFI